MPHYQINKPRLLVAGSAKTGAHHSILGHPMALREATLV
jgi:hypothetical protein